MKTLTELIQEEKTELWRRVDPNFNDTDRPTIRACEAFLDQAIRRILPKVFEEVNMPFRHDLDMTQQEYNRYNAALVESREKQKHYLET